jgi:hypothetical protein
MDPICERSEVRRIIPYTPFLFVVMVIFVHFLREWVAEDIQGRLILGTVIGFIPIAALVALVILFACVVFNSRHKN